MRSPLSVLDGTSPEIRRILLGIALNAAGSGLTLSLFMVYLTDIRGISATTVGMILAWEAVVGLSVTGPVGALIDRLGPIRLMIPGIVLQALGVAALSWVHTPAQAFGVATYISITGSSIWPAQSTLLAQLTEPEERDRSFGLSFMFLNLGFGVGGVFGTLIVRDHVASTYELLYRIDGLTYLTLAIAVWSVRANARTVHEAIDRTRDSGGYSQVLSDRRVWLMLAGGIVMFTCGYGAQSSGVPLFATEQAHLSVRWLGVVFGANTFLIAVLQPWMIQWVRGRSRTHMVALVGVAWAVSWVVLGMSALFLPVVMLCLGQVVFAVGETIWAPVGPALINAIAPDDLRGRYNAVMGLQWGISGVAGPAITGAMLGYGLSTQWWLVMGAGSLIGSALWLVLHSRLDPVTDGRVAESRHD